MGGILQTHQRAEGFVAFEMIPRCFASGHDNRLVIVPQADEVTLEPTLLGLRERRSWPAAYAGRGRTGFPYERDKPPRPQSLGFEGDTRGFGWPRIRAPEHLDSNVARERRPLVGAKATKAG